MTKFIVSGDNSPDSYSSIILLTVYQQITPILILMPLRQNLKVRDYGNKSFRFGT